MARTCHRAVHSMTTLVLSRETSKVFAHVACVCKTRERQFRCRVSLLSIFFPRPSHLRDWNLFRLNSSITHAFATEPLQRISASRGAYVYMYLCTRVVWETGFPYVLISRRHRRNSVYTDTPRFLTRAPREINAPFARVRFRAFRGARYTALRVKFTRHLEDRALILRKSVAIISMPSSLLCNYLLWAKIKV